MKIAALALLCFAVWIDTAAGQTAVEFRERISRDVVQHAYAPAIESLKQFREKDRQVFDANNYDYLLGRMAEKIQDYGLAMSSYQTVVSRGSILAPYAKWHQSQIARASGNLFMERLYLQDLIASAPSMLLYPTFKNRLARSFLENGNYPEAITMLSSPVTGNSTGAASALAVDNGLARENQVLLAQAYLASNRPDDARSIYEKLLNTMANPAQPDDLAWAAVKGLDLLDVGPDKVGKTVAKLTDTEHLRRANVYQFNRDLDDARLHFKSIADNYPASGITPDAIFQIGRGYALQADLVEAVRWYDRVREQFPDHPVAKDALLQTASCYSKLAKYTEAIDRYKKFIDQYPSDERLDRAYLNIVDVYRDQGADQDALKAAIQTELAFKGKAAEALAVFDEVRIYIAESDWSNALAALERLKSYPDLGGSKVPGGTDTVEITFLRAFVLEQLERYDDAVDGYLSIADGRGEYYGSVATERLRSLGKVNDDAKKAIERKLLALNEASRSKDIDTSRRAVQALIRISDQNADRQKLLERLRAIYKGEPAYQNIPHFQAVQVGRRELLEKETDTPADPGHREIADELLFLDIYDEGAPELDASQFAAETNKPNDASYTLALLYQKGDAANKAVAFAEPLWRNVPADYQVELIPHEQLEMLYPVPYSDALIKFAPPRGVDPRFVLSIMRQESRYRPAVKSYAAARGLMQFISDTSNKVAAELGREKFRQDELYDPSIAILFGSQYISDLYKKFPGQPPAVAASYNGGDDNMKRWLLRSRSESADRYVSEIVFAQSKDYVFKVMSNFRMYQMEYDQDLRPRQNR